MRHCCVGLLALASVGAQAATYEISLTNPSFSVIDLTPGDQFFPTYTADAAELLALLTPVDIHEKGGAFEDSTVLPPSIGRSGRITGTLGPGTELIWKASGHLKITVIDTDNGWDADQISVQTTFFSNTSYDGPWGYMELNTGLGGYGGTYERLTQEFDFGVEFHAANTRDIPGWYEIGWFNQYRISSYSIPRPVPEPSTYALMLCGLGAVGLLRRKRSSSTTS